MGTPGITAIEEIARSAIEHYIAGREEQGGCFVFSCAGETGDARLLLPRSMLFYRGRQRFPGRAERLDVPLVASRRHWVWHLGRHYPG